MIASINPLQELCEAQARMARGQVGPHDQGLLSSQDSADRIRLIAEIKAVLLEHRGLRRLMVGTG